MSTWLTVVPMLPRQLDLERVMLHRVEMPCGELLQSIKRLVLLFGLERWIFVWMLGTVERVKQVGVDDCSSTHCTDRLAIV
jgi:hypothetical protein